jgi:vesicle transport protein SEC22
MVRLTLVSRVSDGMPLSSSLENDEREISVYRDAAKKILRNLNAPPNRVTVMSNTDPFFFHYLVAGNVAYLVLADRSFPPRIAFAYLGNK